MRRALQYVGVGFMSMLMLSSQGMAQAYSGSNDSSMHKTDAKTSVVEKTLWVANQAKENSVYYTNRVMVVSFHDMSLHLKSPWNMSPGLFAEDLQALQDHQFHVITNQQFINWLDHRGTVPDNAVLLTLDDGYQSMYTRALPMLLQHHMTATFFDIVHAPVVDFPGFMTWPELQTMAKDGMAIEAHSYDLHYNVKVGGQEIPAFNTAYFQGKWQTPSEYLHRDYQDFLTAKLDLEKYLHMPVDEFAWPYGWGDGVAYTAVEKAGYRFVFTTTPGVVTPATDPMYIPRIDVGTASTPENMIAKILRTAGVAVQPNLVSKPSTRTDTKVPFVYDATALEVNGKVVSRSDHVVALDPTSEKMTSWLPVYYLDQALQFSGIHSTWTPGKWAWSSPKSLPTDFLGTSALSQWEGPKVTISIDGKDTMTIPVMVAPDAYDHIETAYVPVYDVQVVLHRLGLKSTWTGSSLQIS